MIDKEKFKQLADEHGADFSSVADKILKVKERNIDEYACPCYPNDPNHFCISPLCAKEIVTKGRCHCGLFVKKDENNDS